MIQIVALLFPGDYRFSSVVFSHGWCSLAPFTVQLDPLTLHRDLLAGGGQIVRISIKDGDGVPMDGDGVPKEGDGIPEATVETRRPLPGKAVTKLAETLASMLRLDANLTEFYRIIKRHPRLKWAVNYRAGRMLRGESFFEDTVKTILTTNCSWAMTTAMNNNILKHFGIANSRGWIAFPTPERIAESSPTILRSECKLGYRADYIHELAVNAASGALDIESFRTSSAPANELFRELNAIKGIGAYAAANLLRMLGKFDYLGLDSWCRSRIYDIHGDGMPLSDRDIEKLYAEFGEWKGLAMWLEVTKDWYFDKFPLE